MHTLCSPGYIAAGAACCSPVATSWAVTQDLVRGDCDIVALEVVLVEEKDLVSGCLEGDPADLVGAARDPGIQGGRVIAANTQGDGPPFGQSSREGTVKQHEGQVVMHGWWVWLV